MVSWPLFLFGLCCVVLHVLQLSLLLLLVVLGRSLLYSLLLFLSNVQLEAYEEAQKYKQGKFILEKQRMDKEPGWT